MVVILNETLSASGEVDEDTMHGWTVGSFRVTINEDLMLMPIVLRYVRILEDTNAVTRASNLLTNGQ